MSKKDEKRWGLYIVKCNDDTFYCGITVNIDNRVATHNKGRGSKYTSQRLPVSLRTFSGYIFTHGDALREERRVKRLPRKRKIAAIDNLRDSSES